MVDSENGQLVFPPISESNAVDIHKMHDTFIDLLVCTWEKMRPSEKWKNPEVGDWCIVSTALLHRRDVADDSIGVLLETKGYAEFTIKTIGGKVVDWRNAEAWKLPYRNADSKK